MDELGEQEEEERRKRSSIPPKSGVAWEVSPTEPSLGSHIGDIVDILQMQQCSLHHRL